MALAPGAKPSSAATVCNRQSRVHNLVSAVSRAAANKFEGPRSVGYPCPPLPVSRNASKLVSAAFSEA